MTGTLAPQLSAREVPGRDVPAGKGGGGTMLGANLSDQIPGGPNLTLTLTLNSN